MKCERGWHIESTPTSALEQQRELLVQSGLQSAGSRKTDCPFGPQCDAFFSFANYWSCANSRSFCIAKFRRWQPCRLAPSCRVWHAREGSSGTLGGAKQKELLN